MKYGKERKVFYRKGRKGFRKERKKEIEYPPLNCVL